MKPISMTMSGKRNKINSFFWLHFQTLGWSLTSEYSWGLWISASSSFQCTKMSDQSQKLEDFMVFEIFILLWVLTLAFKITKLLLDCNKNDTFLPWLVEFVQIGLKGVQSLSKNSIMFSGCPKCLHLNFCNHSLAETLFSSECWWKFCKCTF